MKVKDLAWSLQQAINKVKPEIEKLRTHKDFHALMEQVLKPILPPILSFSTWEICCGDYENKVLRYDRDFQKYKSCEFADRGRFSNVRMVYGDDVAELEVVELPRYFAKRNLEKQIKELEKDIVEQEEELAKLKRYLKEARARKL